MTREQQLIGAVVQDVSRARSDREARIDALRAHAGLVLAAGLVMMLTGSAGSLDAALGVWVRPVFASLGIVAGLVLLGGLWRDHMPSQVVGLGLVGVFHFSLFLAFAYTLIVAHGTVMITSPWTALAMSEPRPYPIPVYGFLTYLTLGVHGRALLASWVMQRGRK